MPVTREARYLSGIDIGKTVAFDHDLGLGSIVPREGRLHSISHDDGGVSIMLKPATGKHRRLMTLRLGANFTLTITGKES